MEQYSGAMESRLLPLWHWVVLSETWSFDLSFTGDSFPQRVRVRRAQACDAFCECGFGVAGIVKLWELFDAGIWRGHESSH